MAGQDGGDAVGLDWSRVLVLAQLDVFQHDGVETGILKLQKVSTKDLWKHSGSRLDCLRCGQG
jgi:hypothetical protein